MLDATAQPTYPGVPNPLGPRVHAWNGGLYAQGTRYHGPVYTRPQADLPWRPRPLYGLDDPSLWCAKSMGMQIVTYVAAMGMGGIIGYMIGLATTAR